MNRMLILFSTLAFSILFLFYETDRMWGFPFSKQVINAESWIYFFSEHFILVLLAFVIWQLEPEYKRVALVFLLIQIVDCVDYCLTYGERWTPHLPSWNILKVAIFGLSIVMELPKLRNGTRS